MIECDGADQEPYPVLVFTDDYGRVAEMITEMAAHIKMAG